MATFTCEILTVKNIEPIKDADRIEVVVIDGYRSVVPKGIYNAGDPVVYMPEASVIPKWLLQKINLWDDKNDKGRLAGSKGNRIKATKLRGCLSQGIIYPVIQKDGKLFVEGEKETFEVSLGDNVMDQLGVIKYEPEIPASLAGEVFNATPFTLKYDIENWKKYPNIFEEGEEVVFTEKLHGTWTCFGDVPGLDHPETLRRSVIVTSKGLSSKGTAFKFNEINQKNIYIQMLQETKDENGFDILERIRNLQADGKHEEFFNRIGFDDQHVPFYLLGETFGPGIQDLTYGQAKKAFRVFDIYIGLAGYGKYLDDADIDTFCEIAELERVPILYRGPWNLEAVHKACNGKETLSGGKACIMEGGVGKPVVERVYPIIGRVQVKYISDAYLLRKGGTEFT